LILSRRFSSPSRPRPLVPSPSPLSISPLIPHTHTHTRPLSLSSANLNDTQITWLSPPKGHIKGGTVLTIYGSGFRRSAVGKVSRTPLTSTYPILYTHRFVPSQKLYWETLQMPVSQCHTTPTSALPAPHRVEILTRTETTPEPFNPLTLNPKP
jgi:hypothetical protein